MQKRKKVLVTGTGGFIFSNFIRQAFFNKLDREYTFISLDKVKKSRALNNVYTNKNHTFYIGDVADAHFMNVVFEVERPDIVIHGAAETFVDTSIENALPFIRSNVMGTQIVVDSCRRWNTERLIYISTDEVYGHLQTEDEPAWSETAPLAPRNPYAASKASGELLVRAAHTTHGLTYNITRSCNNYGPRQDPEKFMPKIIQRVLDGQKVPVYGQGLQVRDWLHVFDNCDAIIKVMTDGKPNETYNIAANQEYSNVEIFQMVCNVLGKGYDLIEFVPDRPGHDFRYSINSSKLRELGWCPKYKFKDGLVQTAQWYVNNQWFLRQ
jgi:dTDP-glucose 4,6-dehydratase